MGLPNELEIAFLCDVLHLNYWELLAQPEDWVKKMLFYQKIKAKAQSDQQRSKRK